ncbi:MAG: sugar transferase, partial [Ignavibacteria bacterium]|nr:sugar transferase [Ignavibacteria bacterium]
MLVERKKRIFDFFASLILIIVTLPLQIIIYLVIFIIQKDNPLFIQERGLTLEKFRF